MNSLWLTAALLLSPLLATAQDAVNTDSTDSAPNAAATPMGTTAPKPAADTSAPTPAADAQTSAFQLDITAPDDIKTLLERHLELQRYRSLADLRDDELSRLMEMSKLDIQNLVATLGYFSPVIDITRADAGAGLGQRTVHISVVAGEPVRVNQVLVHFSGPIATDPQAAAQRTLIEASWLLPAGNRFTQASWGSAKQQALSQLTSQRYPTGTISESLADVDPLTHTAKLDITLNSGPAYKIGALVTTGLNRFDAELVRRLARLPDGSDYNLKELMAAQQRLSNSGYFNSAFVRVDTTSDPQAAQILVSVREARLQKITLGLGASSDSGARFSAEYLHQQVHGLGWRALSKISLDRDTKSISAELIAPPDEAGWRRNTSLLLLDERSGTSDVGSQRWRAGAMKEGERIDRNYYLEYDRADTTTADAASAQIAESLSINFALTRRQFDTLPFPTSGWAAGMEIGGGTTLGSEHLPFSRVLTRWQSFLPLGSQPDSGAPDLRAGRLALRAEVGAVAVKDGTSLPSTLLFLTGGATSVRGYALRSIGITQADGTVVAGRYMTTGSLEWQRPITVQGRLTDWEGALFIDAGAVADKPADLHAQVGVGGGVRWKTPVGPLQIDLAYGVAVQKWRLHLNVGFVF
ncbi:BamA/TamA family outer membrane protein [Rhodoferax sp.]|uniref:autotransporter assembly complex protein TamA n=1 Tax=Rhodoferax sp. TaxID=50421 RepID=UPI002847ED02|nr:BamA/TamA family outer membrane protein [Rhodoferax sp.]MDR3370536.1 BamA/TamA family outer membrane protein [Rhodoferax sp.]